MKKILITGVNSYVGNSFEQWLENFPGEYEVVKINLRDKMWHKKDFSKFDVILHLAGIVHKKEKSDMRDQYFKVNRDLTIELAKKAKSEGVNHFIFMSTMAVYGEIGRVGKEIVITKETKPKPKTFYGESKLEAEFELQNQSTESFKVLILRPPMIYGPNCPGNYSKLERIAVKSPVFPMLNNCRSMVHIDKLCFSMKDSIDKESSGIGFPQDEEYMNTSYLVKRLAKEHGKKIILSKSLGLLMLLLSKRVNFINKIFGNLVYKTNTEKNN